MKLNRNSKIFINYFLGPLLFVWLSWSIYQQIKNQPNLENAWQGIKESFSGPLLWNVLAVFVLMFINWSIEAVKWKICVQSVQRISFVKALRAVISGVSFSVSTPNRIGEYLGRVLYMDEGNRLRTISVTIVGSMSQLLITVLMGCIALFVMQRSIEPGELLSPVWLKTILYNEWVLYTGIIVLAGYALFYFRLSRLVRWLDQLRFMKRFSYLTNTLESFSVKLLLQLLALSTIRFAVFILQYYLIFPLFGVEVSWWDCCWGVSLSFIIMAVIPTIAILELPLRGSVMTAIFSLYTINSLGVGFSTATIWLINLVIPAIIGSLLILGLRKLVKEERIRDT